MRIHHGWIPHNRGHYLFLGQAQHVTEPIQALVSSCASSLSVFQITLEVVDPGLELMNLGSGECHLPKEMGVVVSQAIPLTGGAIQPPSQDTDLDRLIGQQESRIVRARGRAMLPSLYLHGLIVDLSLQSLESGDMEGLAGGGADGALPADVLVRLVGDMRHVEEEAAGRAGTLGVYVVNGVVQRRPRTGGNCGKVLSYKLENGPNKGSLSRISDIVK
ncbi:hypothetical protein PInf_002618 [Phytophthora infestans]|nr:hypothetical protein PInf_002618 [Phytophthora infestans]